MKKMSLEQCLVTSEEVALTRACLMYEAVLRYSTGLCIFMRDSRGITVALVVTLGDLGAWHIQYKLCI